MFDWAGHGGCVLYDPLAVAVAADPAVAVFQRMAVGIENRGELTLGQTVPLRGSDPNVRVCVDVDGPRVVESIVQTILSQ
jgi:inosine-uridine nucleoside N-ribohydrolase